MFEDRRLYPRIHVEIPAEVEDGRGESADVTLLNISLNGLLIEGGSDLLKLKAPAAGLPLELKVHFGIDDEPVHCHCRVVYNQRQSQNCMRFGVIILSLDYHASEKLQAFIDRSVK
ncbi:MAG: PilZ domain-containing protein [Neptuniibacter sp.]